MYSYLLYIWKKKYGIMPIIIILTKKSNSTQILSSLLNTTRHRATRAETRIWHLTLHWERDIKYYQKVFLSLFNCLCVLLVFGVGFYYSILVEIGDIFIELCNNFERRWTVLLGKRNSELIYFLWHLSSIASNLVFNQFRGIFRNSWNKKLWVYIGLYFSFYLSFTHRTYSIAKGNF